MIVYLSETLLPNLLKLLKALSLVFVSFALLPEQVRAAMTAIFILGQPE